MPSLSKIKDFGFLLRLERLRPDLAGGAAKGVNAGAKAQRLAGVKMHQLGSQEGPPRGAFLRFGVKRRWGWLAEGQMGRGIGASCSA